MPHKDVLAWQKKRTIYWHELPELLPNSNMFPWQGKKNLHQECIKVAALTFPSTVSICPFIHSMGSTNNDTSQFSSFSSYLSLTSIISFRWLAGTLLRQSKADSPCPFLWTIRALEWNSVRLKIGHTWLKYNKIGLGVGGTLPIEGQFSLSLPMNHPCTCVEQCASENKTLVTIMQQSCFLGGGEGGRKNPWTNLFELPKARNNTGNWHQRKRYNPLASNEGM